MSVYITADIEYQGKQVNVELPVGRLYFDTYLSDKLGIHTFEVLNSDQVVVRNFEGFAPIKNWQLSYSAANHLVSSLMDMSDWFIKYAQILIDQLYDGNLWDFIYGCQYDEITYEASISDYSDLGKYLLFETDLVDYEMLYRYVDWHALITDYPNYRPDISDEKERGIAISHELGIYAPDLDLYTDYDRLGSALASYVVDCVFVDYGCFYKLKGEQ